MYVKLRTRHTDVSGAREQIRVLPPVASSGFSAFSTVPPIVSFSVELQRAAQTENAGLETSKKTVSLDSAAGS